MTQSRPTLRRRILACLSPLLLATAVLPLMAPTCGTMAPGVKTFARNSIIIPMDVCYQSMSDDLHKDSSGSGYTPFSCPQAKDPGDVIRAYGLVYQLIRNNVAVYWIINPSKAATTDVDLSIQYNGGPPVLRFDWTTGAISTTAPTSSSKIDYRGGPFVIDGSDFAKASAVLLSYHSTFSGVKLHVSNVAFQANVAKTMAGGWSAGGTVPPKLALLDIGSDGAGAKNAEPVIQGYLTRAGLDTAGAAGTATGTHGQIYDRLLMSDFLPAVPGDWTTSNLYKNGYQILWVPHWAAPSSCSDCTGFSASTCPCKNKYGASTIAAALATIGSFSAAGHDVFAECAGLGSFEGVFANTNTTTSFSGIYLSGGPTTHFETAPPAGVWINAWPSGNPGTDGAILRTGFPSPLMQIGDFPFVVTSGAIEDYRSSAYQAGVIQFISDNTDARYDVFTMLPPVGRRGTTVYLAGHSYSGTDGSFEVAGTRLVLNTLFNLGAACVESGVACNTGLLGECAKGVMSCDSSGQPYCRQLNQPQPEICDGKDNDCNGLVDDGLDTACYDGPAGTKGVGICHPGVSSCIQNSDGSYGMSACLGEMLPADEVCNGLDDNCNGLVDENPANSSQPLSSSCYTGPTNSLDPVSGLPRGICKQGVATCSRGTWSGCTECPAGAWQDPGNPAYANCEILPQPQSCEGAAATVDMTCSGTINCGCTTGATQPCYNGPPGTQGVGICVTGIRTCSGGAWGECSGEQTPLPRDCSSTKDNDCNGVKDDQEPTCISCPPVTDPSRICRVPNIGRKPDGTPDGICLDGVRSCTNGVLGDCAGVVLPFPEICDGKDNNCDGQVDENPDKLCFSGFTCVSGVCVPASCGVENPCPEGFACQSGACVRSGCGDPPTTCSVGQTCTYGACTDPCQGVTCGEGATCASGACTGGGCYMSGCATGQICQQGSCVADPCVGTSCPAGTFCRAGDCVQSCVYSSCSAAQKCSFDGFCEVDPCADLTCSPGQICLAGKCETDPCEGLGCGAGQTCSNGVCEDDPCNSVSCPVGACSEGQCYPVTTPDSSQAATHNSSSGCGCGNDGASPLAALLFLFLVPLARRRRPSPAGSRGSSARRGGGAALWLVFGLALFSLAACGKSSSSVDLSACKQTCGEQKCVDLNFDPSHCGRCDTTCQSGDTCVDGLCGPASAVAPYILSVSPTQASHGALTPVTVTLTGQRFADGATLRAIAPSGTATYTTTFVDAAHLSAQLDLSDVPLTQLELQVVNPDKVISNSIPFDVISLAPALTGVTPASFNTGGVVPLDVAGSGFSATSLCHVDSATFAEEALSSQGDGKGGLACQFDATTVPPGAYSLWVVNDGTVASNKLPIQVTSATPALAALSPSSAESGTFTDVTLVGSGFDITSVAYFGSTSELTNFVDSSHLVVPQYAATSSVTVTVRNGAAGTPSNGLPFTAVANPPTVNNLSVTPSPLYQGDTASLSFSGANFATGTLTGITVVPPVGPSLQASGVTGTATTATGHVSLVGQPDGLYSAYVNFTLPGSPPIPVTSSGFPFRVLSNVAVLTSATPAGASQGTTPTVVLTATNLHGTGTTHVLFTGPGPTNLSLVPGSITATSVTVSLPLTGQDTGLYELAIQNPGATASNQMSFSVLPGLPTVTSVSPPCAVQSDTPANLTITGTNFALADSEGNAVSQVMASTDGTNFYPVPATPTVLSSTQITATLDTRNVPADTTYYLAVWNPPGPKKSNANVTFRVSSTSCP